MYSNIVIKCPVILHALTIAWQSCPADRRQLICRLYIYIHYKLPSVLCSVAQSCLIFLKSCLVTTHITRDFTGFPILSPQIKTISFKDVIQFWRLMYKIMLGYSPIQHDVWLESFNVIIKWILALSTCPSVLWVFCSRADHLNQLEVSCIQIINK